MFVERRDLMKEAKGKKEKDMQWGIKGRQKSCREESMREISRGQVNWRFI